MSTKLEELERVTQMIESDSEIIQGTPVFRGTRIAVRLIAEMVEQGASAEEILEGYPSLTREMITHARVYAATHPKRGRPALQPWSGKKPLRQKKSRLTGVAWAEIPDRRVPAYRLQRKVLDLPYPPRR